MQVDLTGKTAVITGGTSGIGLAAAELFLSCGANVAICGRDETRLREAGESLSKITGDRLLSRRCDVLSKADVAEFADAVETRFGGLDMLVNNAGQGRVSTFADTD
ncbi:MAG: SDR family NAD(P)-dependent oxidoreductase, partial [Fimbriimonadaceae bacterium]|nr:SDR family NAD(P)-dependent oxidoreductase [Alphaproteobacteria bacterium]